MVSIANMVRVKLSSKYSLHPSVVASPLLVATVDCMEEGLNGRRVEEA